VWSALCLQFIPGMLIWYASMQPGRISVTSYDHLILSKVYALFAPFIFGFAQLAPFDFLLVLFIISFLAVAIATRSLKLAPEMRLPIAAMTAISLLMPSVVSGSSFVDIRLPVMLPFVIIASTRFEPFRKEMVFPIAAVALTLLGVRIWTISQAWHDYDHLFAEFRGASTVIAPGARVLVVTAPPTQAARNTRKLGSIAGASFSSHAVARGNRSRGFPAICVHWMEDTRGDVAKSPNIATGGLGPDNTRAAVGER